MEKLNQLSKPGKLTKIIGLVLFALFFYFAGYLIGHKNLVFETNYKPKIANMELAKPKEIDFSMFWQAWNMIQEKYVGTPDAKKMIYGAITGMVDAVGDPYTVFMEPNTIKAFMEDLAGEIQGIGAEISTKDKQIVVVSPLTGSPAEKAGLKPADIILQIDSQTTENLSVEEAVAKIRGRAGTTVVLTVIREGFDKPREFSIKREKITLKSVEWKMKENDIAYIKVSQFGDDTTRLMEEAAVQIKQKNAKAVILDLRRNPGGYLDSAVDMIGIFVDKNTIAVKEKDRGGKILEESTKNDPILKDIKLIILTDEGSASASEIVAGALQDLGRAKLVGAKTFGKGSVQSLEELAGGASLKITIAEWLTPKDRVINHQGIEPDIKIDLTEDDAKVGRDPQLDRALELAK